MSQLPFTYETRLYCHGTYAVVLVSPYTGDVKEYLSLHNNPANAQRRANALTNKAFYAEIASARQERIPA